VLDRRSAPAMYTILASETLPAGGPDEVGNKAWNLMRMTLAGLPVPPAFVLSTGWCQAMRQGRVDTSGLGAMLHDGIGRLERAIGLAFGSGRRPLLVAVRSGAAVSMPGMMETVLDVGLNMRTAEALTCMTGNPRLTWDSFRRFVQGYAEVVAGLSAEPFESLVRSVLRAAGLSRRRSGVAWDSIPLYLD
jgi:pyruvate,orthophosphate dikinase